MINLKCPRDVFLISPSLALFRNIRLTLPSKRKKHFISSIGTIIIIFLYFFNVHACAFLITI